MASTDANTLPRWRGFNLLNAFYTAGDGTFDEDDFRWISDWGFDFVRLPMTYGYWTVDGDYTKLDESYLENIDRVLDHGLTHGIHVSLNFHHAPGYSVNRKIREERNLWKDPEPLQAFCEHWQMFAKRYAGVPSERLSFNLVNEPAGIDDNMTRDDHERVVRAAVHSIRDIDAARLIIADGINYGNTPCPELADLGIAQACRAYVPMEVSHYRAHWVSRAEWPQPSWPIDGPDGSTWDKEALARHYAPWIDMASRGVGVHCSEGGAYSYTPHAIVISWLTDVLEILAAAEIGVALWNLRGPFGILNSGRTDVEYEDWYGLKLDRSLLELLRRY